MFRLVDPHPSYQRSYLRAADEFVAEGNPQYAGLAVGTVSFTRADLDDPATFARLVRHYLDDRREDADRREGWVPATLLWIVEEDEYVGRIALRHRLTDELRAVGGHVGYAVRPAFRRRGAATAALAQVLEVAAGLGIDPVLVTCDLSNEPSRRAIERNGGVPEDVRDGKVRYWLPTGQR